MTDQADKPLTSTQRAINELRQLIFSGELAAGSDHLESELAESLGMSRTPVREAALTLESQGLLELRPRKGVRVLPVSPDDMREIYEVLTELESYAARQAASAGYGAKDMAALERAITDMEHALDAEELEAWAEADGRFHAELVRLGGNSRIAAIVNMLNDQVRRARATTLYMRPLPLRSNEEHRGVFEAIKRGDATAAHDIHHAHRRHAKKMLIELLERHRLRSL